MAFRHLSGGSIPLEGVALGAELRGQEAKQLLAQQLGVSSERLRLVATGGLLQDDDSFLVEESCASACRATKKWRGVTVQVMPDPLEESFTRAAGFEYFLDLKQACVRVGLRPREHARSLVYRSEARSWKSCRNAWETWKTWKSST